MNEMAKNWLLRPFRSLGSPGAVGLYILAVGAFATGACVLHDQHMHHAHEEKLAIETLSNLRASLDDALYRRFTQVISLEALVKSHRRLNLKDPKDHQFFQEHFEQFTSALGEEIPGLMSLQIAPDGVVTYMTDLESNQKAIGYDIFKNSQNPDQLIQSIRDNGVNIVGPMELVQGGEALIARKAILWEENDYKQERYITKNRLSPETTWLEDIPTNFWGFATVLIDPQVLYQDMGINHYQDRYHFAIRGKHGQGERGAVFYGDPSIFEKPLSTVTVSLPNGEWVIAVQLKHAMGWSMSWLPALVGMVITGVLAYSVYYRLVIEIRLQQTNQALMRATRLKDEFLANMSHELRTPLNAILGMTEATLEEVFGDISAEQLVALQTIEGSGNHLLTLINDILDLAKVEAGQVTLDCSYSNIASICEASLEFVKRQALKKQIRLKVYVPEDLPLFWLDDLRMKQVLINLLTNAVKFTPEKGTVSLEVKYSRELTNQSDSTGLNRQLHILVSDTGIGISKDDRKKLFKPFSQVESSLNRTYEGTGLGLALVKSVVDLHGGIIVLTSEVDQGSCFEVQLPCKIRFQRQALEQDSLISAAI